MTRLLSAKYRLSPNTYMIWYISACYNNLLVRINIEFQNVYVCVFGLLVDKYVDVGHEISDIG